MFKIGRNEPCKCGSGKKYKKCCGCITKNKKLSKSKIHFSSSPKKSPEENKIITIKPNKKEA